MKKKEISTYLITSERIVSGAEERKGLGVVLYHFFFFLARETETPDGEDVPLARAT